MMKRAPVLAFIVATCVSAAGCARITVHRTSTHPEIQERTQETSSSVVFGFQSLSQPIDLSNRCPKTDWADIENKVTGWQAVLHVVTLNLYSPWSVNVACPYPPKPKKQDEDED